MNNQKNIKEIQTGVPKNIGFGGAIEGYIDRDALKQAKEYSEKKK